MKIKNVTPKNIDQVIRQARKCVCEMLVAKKQENMLKHSKYLNLFNEIENMVISENNPFCAYKFAREIQIANIPALEQIVINSKQPYLCKAFACNIKKANILKLQEIVIESGDVEAIYGFALDVKGANIQLLGNALKANKCDFLYRQLIEKLHYLER